MSSSAVRSRMGALVALMVVGLGVGPCLPRDLDGPELYCADPTDCRLWEAAGIAGVRIGFHDENGPNGDDDWIAADEGSASTNHGISWSAFQPTPDGVTNSADAACEFAAEHELFQVGFHFAWDQLLLDDLASWVPAIDDPEELRRVLRERVRRIFERCPGLDRIDVLNEPLETFNGVVPFANHFHRILGPDYIAELFEIVREEAPEHVELFLNENFVEYLPARAEAFLDIVRELVANDAPVDAVGLQTHLFIGDPDWEVYRELMQEIAELGLKVFVSELDVPTPPDLPDRFEVQAERYRRVVETCLAVPACDTIIVWGISDADTWLQWFDFLSGPDPRPLLFDEALAPKPAYFAVRDALLRGRGGDHPVAGKTLALTQVRSGRTLVSFTSDGPGVVSPSSGSTNDPRRNAPDGALIELLQPDGDILAFPIPGGAAWRVGHRSTRFSGEIDADGSTLWLQINEGGGLHFELKSDAVAPDAGRDGLALRLTLGSLRLCAVFGEGTLAVDRATRVVLRDAERMNGYSCDLGVH